MDSDFDLFDALARGDLGRVRAAIQTDPELAASRDQTGISLLMQACYRRERDLAERILGHLDAVDVFEAAALGRSGDLRRAVEASPGLLTRRSSDGYTTLHLSAFFDHRDDVAWAIQRGAPVDAIARNPSIVRPLHSAVAAGSLECTAVLLDSGAEIDAIQRGGFTALHGAAQAGHRMLVELLLARGADRTVRSSDGRSASDLAQAAGQASVAERLQAD